MKLILLNAPPRSGKDAIARYLLDEGEGSQFILDRMSMPIKQAFAGLMSASIDYYGNVDGYEADKAKPIPLLGNASYRQWQIDFSEHFMKPLYGSHVFAKLFLDRLSNYGAAWTPKSPELIVVVPDCGFQLEYDTLIAELPPEDIALFHIHRPGCIWWGDSREWVHPNNPLTFFRDIHNNGTLTDLHTQAGALVSEFLNRKTL